MKEIAYKSAKICLNERKKTQKTMGKAKSNSNVLCIEFRFIIILRLLALFESCKLISSIMHKK